MKVTAIVSGGLDSTVLAYALKDAENELELLSFNYGQRHKRELAYAGFTAGRLGAKFQVLDIDFLGKLLSGSALTDTGVAVPHGHYADESMKATIVPNRNAIMLAIAYGIASAGGSDVVALAVHGGDRPIYPDCRKEFLDAFEMMEILAMEGSKCPTLYAPFVTYSKADIVKLGHRLKVPFEDTYSCYEGGAIHCGQCGTCVERKEAFKLAGVVDPTKYAS